MRKTLFAWFTIATFIFSAFLVANPVQAHFTLGNLTGTYRYRTNDFDPHVSGPIGYVWPGSGQNAYSGFPNVASNRLWPGYQSPYPNGNPPSSPTSSYQPPYQLEGSGYQPLGPVPAGWTGDLIFGLNATADFSTLSTGGVNPASECTTISSQLVPCGWDTWMILIPPGFEVSTDSSQIVSTLTNDYANIYVIKLSPYDRYAPGWTMISIRVDAAINPRYNHQFINFTKAGEWYYARVNGVTAPLTAGRYFFKMFLFGGSDIYGLGPTLPGGNHLGELGDMWVNPANWPVLLVEGEVDPSIISGTIRYGGPINGGVGGYNVTLNGLGIQEAGRVWAKMETGINPYTGAQTKCPPETYPGESNVLGCKDAVGYWNATAQGYYEVEGVGAGVYTIYASAAGFPQSIIASGVSVNKGGSLHLDGYLQQGPVIHGNVFSKHQFGDEPWPGNTYIKIEFYDAPTLSNIPDSSAHLVSWSPLPCVAGGQELYFGREHAAACGDPRLGSAIAFPWHEYTPSNGYLRDVSACFRPESNLCFPASTTTSRLTSDPQGVGPPQHWFVQGGTTNPFHFEFGVKGEYGAPRDFDGMVPQVYATWVNGLTPGRYYARVWVFRYVQTALDGLTFQEYYFDITPQEWAGDVTLPIDVRLSSWVNKTVHYHNLPGTINEDSINTGAGFLYGYLLGGPGEQIYSYNVTGLGLQGKYATGDGGSSIGCGAVTPSSICGFSSPAPIIDGENLDPARINAHAVENGRANIQFWGINDTWGGENYGIPSGSYAVITGTEGYVEQSSEQVSVTLSGTVTQVSDHMYRGVGFNVTLYSIDWEHPAVNRPWVWGNDQGGLAGNQVNRGSEIDLGFYANDTLTSYLGDALGNLPATLTTTGLFQGLGGIPCQNEGAVSPRSRSCTMMDGGGRNIHPNDGANMSFFGHEAGDQWVGGNTWGTFGWLVAVSLQPSFTSNANWPNSMTAGTYEIRAWTYGYVQDQIFSVYVQQGQVADVRINLIIGVNVTLDILLKKQHIIAPAPANMSARVRLFDEQGDLAAEWMSSEGTYVTANGFARSADGTTLFPFISQGNLTNPGSHLNSYNFVPGGTRQLHVQMAGLPQQPPIGMRLTGAYFGDPIFTPYGCDFEIVCFQGKYGRYLPLENITYPFANSGILGSPDYQGGWTAEVDFVNWYRNNSMIPELGNSLLFPDPGAQTPSEGTSISPLAFAQYYPPVPGLLLGESYHIIPGTSATSGISLTEDAAVGTYLHHSMAANHLGPYSQQAAWLISGTHLSGEASGIFEVDLNGFISGSILAYTYTQDYTTLSWARVSAVNANNQTWNFYTFDGVYEMFLMPGTYQVTVSSPGYVPQTLRIAVSSGEFGTTANLYLREGYF